MQPPLISCNVAFTSLAGTTILTSALCFFFFCLTLFSVSPVLSFSHSHTHTHIRTYRAYTCSNCQTSHVFTLTSTRSVSCGHMMVGWHPCKKEPVWLLRLGRVHNLLSHCHAPGTTKAAKGSQITLTTRNRQKTPELRHFSHLSTSQLSVIAGRSSRVCHSHTSPTPRAPPTPPPFIYLFIYVCMYSTSQKFGHTFIFFEKCFL